MAAAKTNVGSTEGDIRSAAASRKFGRLQRIAGGAFSNGFSADRSRQAQVIGNGVPLPMGRAVARAVKRAMGYEFAEVGTVPIESNDGICSLSTQMTP